MLSEEQRLDAKEQALNNSTKEITLDELSEVLGSTIKHDNINKVIAFTIFVGNYLGDEQSNIMFRSESSTGKSYLALELQEYFPKEDVEIFGYVSPTAFFHEFGVYSRETHTYNINMHQRIYIATDQQSTALLTKLRSMLSHDAKELRLKITDKGQKSGFRTRNIIINGFPTFITCTATGYVNLQESTRFFQISPDIDRDKIADAIRLSAEKEGNYDAFAIKMASDSSRELLKLRIQDIKAAQIKNVIIPDADKIAEDFIAKRKLNPRHMRDFPRLLRLIKYWTLLNFYNRQRQGDSLIASELDKEVAFILYGKICESNELSISPEILEIYKKVFEKYCDPTEGITKQTIYMAYFKEYGRHLGVSRLEKEIFPDLMGAGLIYFDETTGKGGKAKVYRLTKFMEGIERKEVSSEQIKLPNGKPISLLEKLNLLLDVLLPKPMTIDEIIKQTDGKILQEEIPRLLQQLYNEGKVFQPNGYRWQRV